MGERVQRGTLGLGRGDLAECVPGAGGGLGPQGRTWLFLVAVGKEVAALNLPEYSIPFRVTDGSLRKPLVLGG